MLLKNFAGAIAHTASASAVSLEAARVQTTKEMRDRLSGPAASLANTREVEAQIKAQAEQIESQEGVSDGATGLGADQTTAQISQNSKRN